MGHFIDEEPTVKTYKGKFLDEPAYVPKGRFLDEEPSMGMADGKPTPVRREPRLFGGDIFGGPAAWAGGGQNSEEALPMIGQTAGSLGGYFGSVGGATAGQALRQGVRAIKGKGFQASEIPAEAARTATIEAVFRGGGKLLKPVAGRLMNSVLKPAAKQVMKGKNLGLEAAEAGIYGTKKGMLKKASGMVTQGEDELQMILSGSQGQVNIPKALQKLDELEASYTRIGNTAGLNEIQNLKTAIQNNLKFGSYGNVPAAEANVLKRDLYNILKESQFGTGEVSPAVAVRKTAARGLKEGVEQAEPRVIGINKRIGLGGRVRDALEKRMAAEEKSVMLPFFESTGFGASAFMGHPEIAAMILARRIGSSPIVKSSLAHGLVKAANNKPLGRFAALGSSEFGRRLFGQS